VFVNRLPYQAIAEAENNIMVSKPNQSRLIVKSLGRDPRNTSTAAKAHHTLHTTPSITSSNSKYAGKKSKLFTSLSLAKKKDEPVSSNTRTGSAERRLLAFYTEYRPEKLLEVEDILKMYSGREEELFTALVKKYGPEPVGPNYKSRNNSVRRKSKKQVVAEARDDLHSTHSQSWSEMSPDTMIEVPLRIRLRVPKGDESEVDRDLLEQEKFHSFQLDLATERVFDEIAWEMLHNSFSCFFDIFDCGDTCGSESISEHMVDFPRDRHLAEVESWEDEESLASC
jgi:hypothetical protein